MPADISESKESNKHNHINHVNTRIHLYIIQVHTIINHNINAPKVGNSGLHNGISIFNRVIVRHSSASQLCDGVHNLLCRTCVLRLWYVMVRGRVRPGLHYVHECIFACVIATERQKQRETHMHTIEFILVPRSFTTTFAPRDANNRAYARPRAPEHTKRTQTKETKETKDDNTQTCTRAVKKKSEGREKRETLPPAPVTMTTRPSKRRGVDIDDDGNMYDNVRERKNAYTCDMCSEVCGYVFNKTRIFIFFAILVCGCVCYTGTTESHLPQ